MSAIKDDFEQERLLAKRRAEEELVQANAQLENLNRTLEQRVAQRTGAPQEAVSGLEDEVRQRMAVEGDLARANAVLRMVIACNQAVVRAKDERELMQEICRIALEVGGYRMAWVGLAEDDAARTVLPVAAAGFEAGYLASVKITWADDELGRGPTGTAIRTGRPRIGQNFLTAPELAPWRAEALKRGFQSSVALPMSAEGRVLGALTIYAAEPEGFGEARVKTLWEMADNLAFGIASLRTREALRRRSEQLRSLAAELTQAEERERRRLAVVLHDHLQQVLVGAKFSLDVIARRADAEQAQAVGEVQGLLTEAIATSKSLTVELSPPVLYEHGLAAALAWLGGQMKAKHGLSVDVAADGGANPKAQETSILLFQAARELLFNVVKHAGVDRAAVNLRVSGDGAGDGAPANMVRVSVSDKGRGFDPALAMALVVAEADRSGDGDGDEDGASAGNGGGRGFGLFSIKERLEAIGGRMEIDSAPGKGSTFTLLAPR